MKKSFSPFAASALLAFLIFSITFQTAFAQDGVRIAATSGTADPSAMLDVISSSKGLLVPRVSLIGLTNNTSPVNNPATGLLVYNLGSVTVPAVGFYYWTGAAWVQLTAGGMSGAGTVNYITKWTASNALGNSVLYDNGTNVGIGTTSPNVALDMSLRTDAIGLPVGSTGQRPTGANGYFRYNNSNASVELYSGGAWNTVYTTFGTFSNPLTSTTQADAMNLPSGYYYFNFPGSTGTTELYYRNNMSGGAGYVLVFTSAYGAAPTVNMVGRNFPWTKFLVQTSDGSTRATAFFPSTRLFNTDGSTTASTGGTHVGYRVFIGAAGGMGIYNNAQLPCNWGNSSGSVAAGFNGSTCGNWPHNLLWGTGTASATYTAVNTSWWEIWIAQ